MSLLLVTLFFSFGGYSLGLFLLQFHPSFNLTAQDQTIAVNASRLEEDSQPHCSSNFYGYGLKEQSCLEALRIFTAEHRYQDSVYVQRGTGTGGDYQLPKRYLSPDGNCAVDILLQPGVELEIATLWEVATPARNIIIQCRDIGGEVDGIGTNNKLIVRVSRYNTRVAVLCGQAVPGLLNTRDCQPLLDSIPASGRKIEVFGPAGDPGVDVAIPKTFNSAGFYTSCRIKLSATNSLIKRDQSTDWDIWVAAVALDSQCWRRGFSGVAYGIGVKRALKLDMSHTLQLGGNSTGSGLGKDGVTRSANE